MALLTVFLRNWLVVVVVVAVVVVRESLYANLLKF